MNNQPTSLANFTVTPQEAERMAAKQYEMLQSGECISTFSVMWAGAYEDLASMKRGDAVVAADNVYILKSPPIITVDANGTIIGTFVTNLVTHAPHAG